MRCRGIDSQNWATMRSGWIRRSLRTLWRDTGVPPVLATRDFRKDLRIENRLSSIAHLHGRDARVTGMASICYKIFSALFAFLLPFRLFAEPIKADVCVYGGTSAGVIAAEAVAKAGKTVVLVEPGRHLGGLSSGGLGQTDIGNKMVIGGMSRDFYRRVGKHYGKAEGWQFAPSVAEKVFGAIVDENRERVRAMFQFRIVRARKEGSRIREIILEHALTDDYNAPAERGDGQSVSIEAGEFIDASYEGDLMAAAGVKYTVGREGVSQYGEPLNGVRAQTPKHQFPAGIKVDPFVKAGDPSSGLLPLMKELDPGSPGAADARVQAYNFRICLTRKKENQLRFQPPPGYDAAHFELLSRYLPALKAANHKTSLGMFLKLDVMPEDKTDINNNGAISTDFIGMSWEYPDASYGKRGKICRAHRDYVQGFFYYMATDARVPENGREERD